MCDNVIFNQCLDVIIEFKEIVLYGELYFVFKQIGDIEWIFVCLVLCLVWLCDLVCLCYVMQQLFELYLVMSEFKQFYFIELCIYVELMDELCDLFECVIKENLFVVICDGGVIVDGYSVEFDEWCDLVNGVIEFLECLEVEECDCYGIDILKVGYNNVYGFYI